MASPAAAITSVIGEERARTRAMRRSSFPQLRFASAKRPISRPSMPKACTTRSPASVSSAISVIFASVATDSPVEERTRFAMRMTGIIPAGTSPKTTSESFQSRRMQFVSITRTVIPSRRYVAIASVTAAWTSPTSAENRLMRSPEWWREWKLGGSVTSRSKSARRRSAVRRCDAVAMR